MEEKKEKTMQEKINRRSQILWAVSHMLIVFGGLWASTQIWSATPYYDLRSDEYMDDPAIPYNERDNATYTFTDQWLEEKWTRLMWYCVPGYILFAVGFVLSYSRDWLINEKEVHKTFCKGSGEPKYCSECGLKLSELEKK